MYVNNMMIFINYHVVHGNFTRLIIIKSIASNLVSDWIYVNGKWNHLARTIFTLHICIHSLSCELINAKFPNL